MDALEEMFGLDSNSPEVLRADFLVESDMRLLESLIAIRKLRKFSQRDVGRIMGISQPSVADFEAHDSNPRLSTIRRYAMAVGALVRHEAVPDEGQLNDGTWQRFKLDPCPPKMFLSGTSATLTVSSEHMVKVALGECVLQEARDSTRTDFALVA